MTLLAANAFGPGTSVGTQCDGERPALPLMVYAEGRGVEFVPRLGSPRSRLDEALNRHGAVLYRGFNLKGADGFERVCKSFSPTLMEYRDRATPRTAVTGAVMTATDYAPNVSIHLHNENVFAAEFPRYLFFCCLTPADEGGATPLADVRRVYERIPANIRAEFERRDVTYVRTFGGQFGLDWRDVFQTDERRAMEEYCRQAQIEWEWNDKVLRTSQRRPAVGVHPDTGERVWLNHAVTLHVSSLEPGKRQMLLRIVGEIGLPNNVYYGDGAEIADETLAAILEAYEAETRSFDWQTGDVLVIDNMLVAHGRRPFTGDRELLVAMAEPTSWKRVATSASGTSGPTTSESGKSS